MDKFVPKNIPEKRWTRMAANKPFAVKVAGVKNVFLRIGSGIGLYLVISYDMSGALLIKTIKFDNGDVSDGTPFPSKQKSVRIGRVEECEMVIKNGLVSRIHAELKVENGILVIRDFGSTNGTFINQNNVFFDIEDYIAHHSDNEPTEGTLDWLHEEFGPTLSDFLKLYKKDKTE